MPGAKVEERPFLRKRTSLPRCDRIADGQEEEEDQCQLPIAKKKKLNRGRESEPGPTKDREPSRGELIEKKDFGRKTSIPTFLHFFSPPVPTQQSVAIQPCSASTELLRRKVAVVSPPIPVPLKQCEKACVPECVRRRRRRRRTIDWAVVRCYIKRGRESNCRQREDGECKK